MRLGSIGRTTQQRTPSAHSTLELDVISFWDTHNSCRNEGHADRCGPHCTHFIPLQMRPDQSYWQAHRGMDQPTRARPKLFVFAISPTGVAGLQLPLGGPSGPFGGGLPPLEAGPCPPWEGLQAPLAGGPFGQIWTISGGKTPPNFQIIARRTASRMGAFSLWGPWRSAHSYPLLPVGIREVEDNRDHLKMRAPEPGTLP
eukprot:7112500-Pyramimonas_sp.AAC.1